MTLNNALRGVGGEFEIGRVLLAGATFLSVVSPIGFEIFEVGWNGGHFNVTEWCVAYPGGIAALVGVGLFGVGNKDVKVAAARAATSDGTQQP